MSTRVVSERLIVHIDFAAWMGGSFLKISPNSQRVAYAARVGTKQFVVMDGNEEKPYDAIVPDTLRFSPDSQRVAYAARVGTKQFVVVDGREERRYDGVLEGTLSFSPDSQRVDMPVLCTGRIGGRDRPAGILPRALGQCGDHLAGSGIQRLEGLPALAFDPTAADIHLERCRLSSVHEHTSGVGRINGPHLPSEAASPAVMKRRKTTAKIIGEIIDNTIPTAIRV